MSISCFYNYNASQRKIDHKKVGSSTLTAPIPGEPKSEGTGNPSGLPVPSLKKQIFNLSQDLGRFPGEWDE